MIIRRCFPILVVGAVALSGCSEEDSLHINLVTTDGAVTPQFELRCIDASLTPSATNCSGNVLTLLDAYQIESSPELTVALAQRIDLDGDLAQFNASARVTRLSAVLSKDDLSPPAVSHRGLNEDGSGVSIRFDAYIDHILSGQLTGKLDHEVIEIHDSKDPECMTDDMRGICYREEPLDTEVIIDFRLLVTAR